MKKRKKGGSGKREDKKRRVSPEEKEDKELDAYVDANNQLRDQAIDRFCNATCQKAQLDAKAAGTKGGIVWISSLAFEAALTASEHPDATVESVKRKLGFKDVALDECDVVLGSVYSEAHWSLLVLFLTHRAGGRARAFHYDSIHGHNVGKARKIVKMLSRAGILLPDVRVVDPSDFPQQTESYECGHVVLMTVNSVASKYALFAHSPTEPLRDIEFPDISKERIERIRTNIVKRVLDINRA